MKVPDGKTVVILTASPAQCMFKEYDIGYIDGYVVGGDGRTYAVVVGIKDGIIDLVPMDSLRATELDC